MSVPRFQFYFLAAKPIVKRFSQFERTNWFSQLVFDYRKQPFAPQPIDPVPRIVDRAGASSFFIYLKRIKNVCQQRTENECNSVEGAVVTGIVAAF